eukprot:4741431-Prorocentrum_lima.AAC.1
MAVLCLAQLKGLWQIAYDEEEYSYLSPDQREPNHAVTHYLATACARATWPSGADVMMGAQAPPLPPLPATATGTGSMTQDWLQAIQAGLQQKQPHRPRPHYWTTPSLVAVTRGLCQMWTQTVTNEVARTEP